MWGTKHEWDRMFQIVIRVRNILRGSGWFLKAIWAGYCGFWCGSSLNRQMRRPIFGDLGAGGQQVALARGAIAAAEAGKRDVIAATGKKACYQRAFITAFVGEGHDLVGLCCQPVDMPVDFLLTPHVALQPRGHAAGPMGVPRIEIPSGAELRRGFAGQDDGNRLGQVQHQHIRPTGVADAIKRCCCNPYGVHAVFGSQMVVNSHNKPQR